jgi:hypothetical protein
MEYVSPPRTMITRASRMVCYQVRRPLLALALNVLTSSSTIRNPVQYMGDSSDSDGVVVRSSVSLVYGPTLPFENIHVCICNEDKNSRPSNTTTATLIAVVRWDIKKKSK